MKYFIILELRFNMDPIKSTIDPRAQLKQTGTIDCLKEFHDVPKMTITFSSNNIPQKLDFSFPLYLNKYIEKAEMDSNNFFLRWRNLEK